MSVLLAAVESGSLSKASRKLRLPLATVSRKVAELEAHLNATLLIRSAKGLELTPAGRSYVTGAKAILEQLNGHCHVQQVKALRPSSTGSLTDCLY